MARREPIEITLGERSFKIRALTIDQMQAMEAALGENKDRAEALPIATAVLRVALERDHKEIADNLGEIECEATDVSIAFQAVLRHGGFLQGEAPAAAVTQPPSTGDGSADASPPVSG